MPEVIHRAPKNGAAFTPCCNKTVFELSRLDRITANPDLVTCKGGKDDSNSSPPQIS